MVSIVLVNIIVSCIAHIALMYAGKCFFRSVQKCSSLQDLLDKIYEGVIVVSINEETPDVMFTNAAAKKFLTSWSLI